MAAINPFGEIQSALDMLGKGYKIQRDPTRPDRAIVSSPKGQTLNINLTPDIEGAVGKTWTLPTESGLQAKVIRPELTGTYLEESGDVEWRGKTSSQQTAHIFHQAALLAKKRNTDWKSELHNLLSKGDQDLGISPAPSIDYRSSPAIQRQTTGQIAVNIRSSNEQGVAFRDQSSAVVSSLQRAIALGSQTKLPVPEIKVQEQEPGGVPFTFETIARQKMHPGDKGELRPDATPTLPSYLQVEGQWYGVKSPEKRSKAPKLGVGISDEVVPYRMYKGQAAPEPVQPSVTTNTRKPKYAYANVLAPGETEPQAKQRGWFVYGKSPIAGTAFNYETNDKSRYSFYGRGSTKSAPIEGVSVYDILEGRTKLELGKGVLGKPLGGGVPVAHVGKLTQEGKKPENIKLRLGPATFRATSSSLYIPDYIDQITGKGVDLTANDLDENGQLKKDSGKISTTSMLPQLQKIVGMPVKQRPGEGMGLSFAGPISAGLSLKERDTKAGITLTGQKNRQRVEGQDIDVEFFTGEAKGPGVLTGFFEGLNYKQFTGLLKDYAQTPAGAKGGQQMLETFKELYRPRHLKGEALGVDMDFLAETANAAGANFGSAQELQARIFENTIMAATPGSKENRRNLMRYGAGLAKGGEEMPLGVWHPETYAWQKENFARAMRSQAKPGQTVTDEQIEAEWNKNFSATPTGREGGFLNVSQRLQGGEVFMNKLFGLRMENIHGASAGWEWLSGLSEKFPTFARSIGAHVENFVPRGKTQQAALGLLKYGVWQGQRRESYNTGEPMEMPNEENMEIVSSEKLMQIGAFLKGEKGNASSLEQLEAVANQFFKGTDKSKILYNPDTKSFIPNPWNMLGTTFKELGVEAASTARPYMGLLSSLADIANPFNEMSGGERIEAAMEASQGMYNYTSRMISSGGDFFKNLFSRMVPSGYGGRTSFDPTLAPNEQYLSPDMYGVIGRRMGYRGEQLQQFIEQAQSSGAQLAEARYPQLTQTAINAGQLQTKETRQEALGNEAYQAIERSAYNRGNIGVPGTWGQANAGDWDRDPVFAALGFVRNSQTGELQQLNDQRIGEQQMTREMAANIEKRFFQRQSFRDVVSSGVQQMVDYVKGKDVMRNVIGGIGNFNAFEAVGAGINTWMSKSFGMGVGYNPRRAVLGGMAAGGYSEKEIQDVLDTVPSFYQPALDKMLKGRIAGGVPSAALIATSYMGQGEVANPRTGKKEMRSYLHLGSTGEGTERANTTSPSGTILPEIKSPGLTLDVKEMLKNPMEVLAGSSFAIERFARGAPLTKGNKNEPGDAGLTAEQTARWFAMPGETEELTKLLGNDRNTWASNLMAYQTNIINRVGKTQGIEAILSSPFWRSIITRSGSKGISNFDPISGEERGAPGGEKAFNELMEGLSPRYETQTRAGIAMHDIMHKGRQGLRGLTSSMIKRMALAMPENTTIGQGSRTIARMLGVPLEKPNAEKEMDERFEKDFGNGPSGESPKAQMLRELQLPENLRTRPAAETFGPKRLQKAMKDDDYLIFDTETTGKGPEDEIISLALKNARGETVFNQRVRPTKTPVSPEATKVHGITDKDLENEPQWAEVGPKFLEAIQGKKLLGYNVKFDKTMLQQTEELSAQEMGHDVQDFTKAATYIDVMGPAEAMGYGKKSRGLQTVASEMGIQVDTAHEALADVETTRQVAQRLQQDIGAQQEQHQQSLKEAGPLSDDEFRMLQRLQNSQESVEDNWKYNVLQERHQKYGVRPPSTAAPKKEKQQETFQGFPISKKREYKNRIVYDIANPEQDGPRHIVQSKEYGTYRIAYDDQTKSLPGAPVPEAQVSTKKPRGRSRKVPAEPPMPPTPPAGTDRVQQEGASEERVRFMKGMTNEVEQSMTQEDVERLARWMGVGGQQRPGVQTPSSPEQAISQAAKAAGVQDPNKPVGGTAADVVGTQKYRGSGVSLRVGHQVRGYALHLASAMQRDSVVPQLNEILTNRFKLPGEETVESITKRVAQAYSENPDEFLGALPAGLRDRLEQMKALQQEREYARAFVDVAPGLGQDYGWIRGILESALKTEGTGSLLGQEIAIGASFSAMIGTKAPPGMKIRSAKALSNSPVVQSLKAQLAGSGVLSSDQFGEKEIAQVKSILAQRGRGIEEIAQERGIDLNTATDEQLVELKTAQAREMSYQTALKRVGKLTPRAAANAGLGDVQAVSKEFQALEGSGSLSDKKGYINIDAEGVKRVADAFNNLNSASAKLAESVGHVTKKEERRLELLKDQAALDLKSEALKFIKGTQEQRMEQLVQGITGGTAGMDEAKELASLIKGQPGIDKEIGAIAQERAELGSEKWGSAARRMLGGFGLMYAQSIFGIATQGLGFGMGERQKLDQAGAAGAYQYAGIAQLPYNQQNILASNRALYGVNNNPISAGQSLLAQAPIARDLLSGLGAGIGTWGYTQFAAGQIGGATGEKFKKLALPLGVSTALGSLVLDAGARAQDQQGLAYRAGTGKMGLTDYMATEMVGDRGTFQAQREYAQQFEQAAKGGASTHELMDFQYKPGTFDVTEKRKQDLFWNMGMNWNQIERDYKDYTSFAGSDADNFFLLQRQVAEQYKNYSAESQTAATGFLLRSGMNSDDKRLKSIISDAELGGFGEKAALQTAQALGLGSAQMYSQQANGLTNIGNLQLKLSEGMTEGQKAIYAEGLQGTSQLASSKRWGDFVDQAGNVDWDKATNFVMQVGVLASKPSFTALQAQAQAYETNLRAGAQASKPKVEDFVRDTGERDRSGRPIYEAKEMTLEEVEALTREASASAADSTRKLQFQNKWQTQIGALGGSPELGSKIAGMFPGVAPGRSFMLNNLLGADPMTLSALASTNPSIFGQLAGPRNIQGQTLNPNFLATADRDLSGANVTGLGQFRTSLWLGNQTPEQTGKAAFGNINNWATRAAVEGQKLTTPITLPSGRVVSEVGGTMGLQIAGQQEDYNYQMAQIGFQRKAQERDYAYQMQLWGLQDQQRTLGHQYQLQQFGFQERGMALSQEGAQMQNRFWWQNMGMQQQQAQMQRGWTRQDWGFQDETRAMQWGWRQEDFQEQRRFMTGRDRRLAERQMERETISHDREGGQIDKQRARQEELWKLEDERFEIAKEQRTEEWQLQLKQFELQKEQFEAQKQFYLENKKLEDQIIALQRQHWLEQHKMAKEQLDLTEEHAKKTLELQQATNLLQTYMELTNGEMNTLVEDSMIPFLESIAALDPETLARLREFIDGIPSGGSPAGAENVPGYIPGTYVPPQIVAMYATNNATNADAGLTPTGGGRAIGGPVRRGEPTPVGELGTEIFVPDSNGTILSNLDLRNMLMNSMGEDLKSGSVGEQVISSPWSGASSKPAIINVYVGNERLESFIVDTVGGQL